MTGNNSHEGRRRLLSGWGWGWGARAEGPGRRRASPGAQGAKARRAEASPGGRGRWRPLNRAGGTAGPEGRARGWGWTAVCPQAWAGRSSSPCRRGRPRSASFRSTHPGRMADDGVTLDSLIMALKTDLSGAAYQNLRAGLGCYLCIACSQKARGRAPAVTGHSLLPAGGTDSGPAACAELRLTGICGTRLVSPGEEGEII